VPRWPALYLEGMSRSSWLAVLLAAGCASPSADARVAEDVLGTWQGTAVFRGQPLALTLRFERPRGLLRGTISAPDIALLEYPLADVAHDSSRIYFAIDAADGAVAFRGRQTGDTLVGTASLAPSAAAREGGSAIAWRVMRSTAAATPAPYATRDVLIGAQGATLAGTVFVPRGAPRPAPAVLLLQGSSTNRRSDYRFYADRFARAGFVVLAFDKRGNGESTGDYRRASYDDLVFDARDAFDTLAAQPEVDARRIGLWGLSQGAFLAPRVAEHLGTPPAFVVAVSGPGVPISESAAYQDSLRVVWHGFSAPAAAHAAAVNRAVADALRSHRTADSIGALLAAVASEPWRRHTSLPSTAPATDELRGWYWYGRTLDPVEWWRRLRVPVLLVYGRSDELVPASASAERLERVLRDAGHRDVTVRMYPGANHVIKLVASPLVPADAGWAWPVLAPGYVDGMVQWMRLRSGSP
jgi:dienelactone hydrolase